MDYGLVIFAMMELMNRSKLDRVIAPSYNVLVSNVPGQGKEDLYLNGSRMEASYPISTLLPGVNLNTTLLSHGNSLDFGLLGDMNSLPNLDIMAQRMQHHFGQLQKETLVKRGPGTTARKTSKRKAKAKSSTSTKRKTATRGKSGAKRSASV